MLYGIDKIFVFMLIDGGSVRRFLSVLKNFKTVGVSAASSDGGHSGHSDLMRECGRLFADLQLEVRIGGFKAHMRDIALGALSEGGRVRLFVPPHNGSLEIAKEFSEVADPEQFSIMELNTDNQRTLAILKSDIWFSGIGAAGTIGETIRGITWNHDRTYRDSSLTPHFLFNATGMYDHLHRLYEVPVLEGRSKPEVLELFQLVQSVEDLEQAILECDERGRQRFQKISEVSNICDL